MTDFPFDHEDYEGFQGDDDETGGSSAFNNLSPEASAILVSAGYTALEEFLVTIDALVEIFNIRAQPFVSIEDAIFYLQDRAIISFSKVLQNPDGTFYLLIPDKTP